MSGHGEPEADLPEAFAQWIVGAGAVDLSDLETADGYDLAVLACRLDIDLGDGPGGLLGGHDGTDVQWRRWVIAEIRNRQAADDLDGPR